MRRRGRGRAASIECSGSGAIGNIANYDNSAAARALGVPIALGRRRRDAATCAGSIGRRQHAE